MKVWTGETAELEVGATLAVLMRRRMRALKERILMRAGVCLLHDINDGFVSVMIHDCIE